jgi:hypothetical protein
MFGKCALWRSDRLVCGSCMCVESGNTLQHLRYVELLMVHQNWLQIDDTRALATLQICGSHRETLHSYHE